MSDKLVRHARRAFPQYDTENEIGFVARARFALKENRVGDLTADEQIQLDRCFFCDDQIRQRRFFNDRELRNFLMSKYTISWDTANRDIRNTKELFNTSDSDREYKRSVYIEDAEKVAQKAQKAGQFDAYARIMNYASKLQDHFTPKKEDIHYAKLEAFEIRIEFNPEAMGFKPVKNKDAVLAKYRTRKQIMEKIALEAEDAEYED